MISMLRKCLPLVLLLTTSSPAVAEPLDKTRLLEAVEKLASQHEALSEEIANLKKLLGVLPALDGLEPLEPTSKMKERLRVRVEDGIKSFATGDFERAKEDFQRAWEEDPEPAVTNYNLGLAYHRLGNLPLAKKMLKAALEKNPKLEAADKISAYLEGKTVSESSEGELTEEEEIKQTAMINLKQEANSYIASTSLSLPKRRAESVKVLREMAQKAQGSEVLKQKYFLDMADGYARFELYEDALKVLEEYQVAMKGKVLPDGYHTKRLAIEEKKDALNELLDSYIGNRLPSNAQRSVKKNTEELEIFASQLNEFVKEASEDDADFAKITKRLGEYRWGGKPKRHVLIVNRFEELLYSSLEGTLAVDRYQDMKGQRFLQQVTRLGNRMKLKQVEIKEVDLSVSNKKVPYLILYTYIPKHEAFIIVRIPKRDLQSAG